MTTKLGTQKNTWDGLRPHDGTLLAQIVRFSLRLKEDSYLPPVKEMKLRAHVVALLGHACIDRGHPAFYNRIGSSWVPKSDVTELKRRFEELTYLRYPLSSAELTFGSAPLKQSAPTILYLPTFVL